MELTLRRAILDDVELLATMNQRLIEDEKSRNPMSIEEIKDRMNDFIQKDWQADLILFDSRVIGTHYIRFDQMIMIRICQSCTYGSISFVEIIERRDMEEPHFNSLKKFDLGIKLILQLMY